MVNIAVIGCGHWGPNHIRTFSALPESRVIAAVDSDAERLKKIQQNFPGLCLESDSEIVLNNPAVTAVVVAVPTSAHYEIVKAALNAGKHVLCEKPLCGTSSEAAELADIAEKKNLILMTGHVFLFNAAITKIKELLDAGELGKLLYISSLRTNLGPIRTDVNAAYDLAAHDISILNWLLSCKPNTVSATGGCYLRRGIEDVVFVSLRYPDGVMASIQASWLNPKKVRHMAVVGSRKMATWDDLEFNTPVAIYEKGAEARPDYGNYGEFLRVSMWDGEVRLPRINLVEPLKLQNSYFLNCISSGRIQQSNGHFSLGVIQVLEAISESLKQRGAPVTVNA